MDTDRIIGLAGLAIAVVGIPLAFYLARKSRQHPHIRYLSDFDVLMSPERGIAREALKIAYADTNITQVSRSYIAVWNHRGDTVRGADVVEHDPLRVQLGKDDVVLQVQMLSISREACDLKVEPDSDDPSRATISFDFLDQGDGAVFEVLHAGSETARLAGTVRGARMTFKGSAVMLGPPVLDFVAERSRIARLIFRPEPSNSAGRFSPRNLPFVLVTAVVNLGFASFLMYESIRAVLQSVDLVPVKASDLRTVEGQADFAGAVEDANPRMRLDMNPWLAVAMASLLFLGIAWLVAKYVRIQFPKSLVAHRYYSALPGSSGD